MAIFSFVNTLYICKGYEIKLEQGNMKNEYKMVTVSEYLEVLDGEKKLSEKDTQTMISVEKYLTEVLEEKTASQLTA